MPAAVCKFWLQGHCRYGDSCRFQHPSDDMGPPGNRSQQRYEPVNHRSNQDPRGRTDGRNDARKDGRNDGRSGGRNDLRNDPRNDSSKPYNLDFDTIKEDLSSEQPMWILSAYGPGMRAPAQLFGGLPREQSFEEMRLRHYELAAQGQPQQAIEEAQGLLSTATEQMRIALKDIRGAMNFIISAEKKRGNRIEICHNSTEKGPKGKFSRDAARSSQAFTKGGGPSFGQPSVQPSATGSSFGQPSMQASMPGSSFGQPSLGQTSFEKPTAATGSAFGQSSFGQPSSLAPGSGPAFGNPSFGQPSGPSSTGTSFGQHSLGQPAFGQPSGPASTGGPSFGQPTFGQPSMQTPTAGSSFGQPSVGQPPINAAFGEPMSPMQGTSIGSPRPQPSQAPFGGSSTNPPANPFARGNGSFGAPSPFGQPPVFTNTQRSSFGASTNGAGPSGAFVRNMDSDPIVSSARGGATQPLVQRDGRGNIKSWGGHPVSYPGNGLDPCVRRPDGQWEKIWFPDGQPEQKIAQEVPLESYDENLEQQYRYLREKGEFKNGVIPTLPPKWEWTSWDF